MDITQDDIKQLIEYFSRNVYRAKYSDEMCQNVMQKCLDLVGLDYSYMVVNNSNGELSAHYPSQLIIMEAEQPSGGGASDSTSTIYESVHDGNKLRELFGKARSARCRARFPVPVILFRGRNICRSATLSGGPEIYGRSGLDYFFSPEEITSDTHESVDEADSSQQSRPNWLLFDHVRHQDIKLLKALNVGTIVDFMVEKKKVKFGLYVTSSEKVDKENRYSDFTIISLPYPGCEFFKEFRDNNYSAKDLMFDWDQGHVDADIIIPEDTITNQLKICWNEYKAWDLVTLTANYMLLLLHYITEGNSGLLIHCISGWDRTPLYISLLRICLWADGAIHQSLSAVQLLYFTIAYDWMLFGHNLEDRKTKGEDIFYFCFYFLKHMTSEDFSVNSRCKGKTVPPSQPVARTDSDSQLEGAESDGGDLPISSQGSNVSLHSSWSSISSKSQETPPILFHVEEQTNGISAGCWSPPVNSQDTSVNSLNRNIDNQTTQSSSSASSYSSVASVNSASPQLTSSSSGVLCSENQSQIVNSHLSMECSHGTHQDSGLCNGYGGSRTNTSASNSNQSCTVTRVSHSSRTSPVAVPCRTSALRQRNESSSSLSVGSWQFITGTGSLRGSGSNSTCGSHLSSNNSHTSLCEGPVSTDSTSTLTGDNECFIYEHAPSDHNSCSSSCSARKERLEQVRTLFCSCYCKSIGHNLKDGSENTGFGNIIGNFTGKFCSTKRTV